MVQGKLSRESYTSLNEFIEAQLKQPSARPSIPVSEEQPAHPA